MSELYQIEERPAQAVLEVSGTVGLMKIPQELQRGYALVSQAAAEAGVELVGPPYARYLDIDWAKARKQGALSKVLQLLTKKQSMCAGRLVSAPTSSTGEVSSTEIPAGRYLVATHKGAYHKVDTTYNAMTAWAAEQGLSLADHSIESYISDPGDTATADLTTQVAILVL